MRLGEDHISIVEIQGAFMGYEPGRIYALAPKDADLLKRVGVATELFLQDLAALLRAEIRDCACGNEIAIHWVPPEVMGKFANSAVLMIAKDHLRTMIQAVHPSAQFVDADEDPEAVCACGRPIKERET